MEGVFGDSVDDRKVVGGEQSKHGGNGLLRGVSGGGGHTFRDGGVVEGLDAVEDGDDHGEATVEVARGDSVVGEAGRDEAATAAREGEEDGGWRRRRKRGGCFEVAAQKTDPEPAPLRPVRPLQPRHETAPLQRCPSRIGAAPLRPAAMAAIDYIDC